MDCDHAVVCCTVRNKMKEGAATMAVRATTLIEMGGEHLLSHAEKQQLASAAVKDEVLAHVQVSLLAELTEPMLAADELKMFADAV